MDEWLKKSFVHRRRLLDDFARKAEDITTAADHIADRLAQGHRVYVFGNGGSASQAAHFAGELLNRFYKDRPGLAAIALNTDGAGMTAIANDYDFRHVFSRQVNALGSLDDVAVGLSTSGKSANILEGLRTARRKKMFTLALSGAHTEDLEEAGASMILAVPDTDTPAIQEIHLLILHLLAERIESRLFA